MDATEPTTAKFRGRRWHHRRDARFLIVVGVILGLYYGHGYVNGPSRISDRLHERLDQGENRVNILVTSKFPPEVFHMGVYQELGSVRGTTGSTTTLYKVKPANVRALSRRYWIEKIDLAPPLNSGIRS